MNIMTEQNLLATMQQQIESLETKTAFQDHIIEQLNNEIAVHQEQIRDLVEQLHLIGQRVKDMNSSPVGKVEDETPPPHY